MDNIKDLFLKKQSRPTIEDTQDVLDEKGFRWYGKKVRLSPGSPGDGAVFQDPGGDGQPRILRDFRIQMPPGAKDPSKQDMVRFHLKEIKAHLFDTGLTTDDNYPEPIQAFKGRDGDWHILCICKKNTSSRPYMGSERFRGIISRIKSRVFPKVPIDTYAPKRIDDVFNPDADAKREYN